MGKLELTRDEYRSVKKMDRAELAEYITHVFGRGFKAGINAATGLDKLGKAIGEVEDADGVEVGGDE